MFGLAYTKDTFLWCMSAIYLMAFSSLYAQIPGLYGDNGLLPVKNLLKKDINSIDDILEGNPTLLKLMPKLGLSTHEGMDLLCLLGVLISFCSLLFHAARDFVTYILLWMFYLSVYQVGSTFLWFQWDILLLEAGFLTILVAPFNMQLPKKWQLSTNHSHDHITLWLVKWLLFRLMFASGVVKLTSKCPTWWGLTALTVHFESQCLPTPLAWFFHHLPVWFLRLSVVATYVIEIAIPFLFFSPVRSMRIFCFFSQVLLQVLIILTGNYNFFNFLTITLCIPLLDDQFFGARTAKQSSWIGRKIDRIVSMTIYSFLLFVTSKYFSLGINWEKGFSITSKIAFSKSDFQVFVDYGVTTSMALGAVSLGYEILAAIARSVLYVKNPLKKVWSCVQCILFSCVAVFMFQMSLVPYSYGILGRLESRVPAVSSILYEKTEPFHICSSYGLFRVMTGVGGRPEVIVEGSNNLDKGWKEYEFLYKPGNMSRTPPIVAPHQPRLDWQMWFAALGSYQHNKWFVSLMYRLLMGEPDVLQLLAENPFKGRPPKYIRATLYHYHFTKPAKEKKTQSVQWWHREKKSEYFPPMSKDHQPLVQFMKEQGFIEDKISKMKSKNFSSSLFKQVVVWIRQQTGQPEGFNFVCSFLFSVLVIRFFHKLIRHS